MLPFLNGTFPIPTQTANFTDLQFYPPDICQITSQHNLLSRPEETWISSSTSLPFSFLCTMQYQVIYSDLGFPKFQQIFFAKFWSLNRKHFIFAKLQNYFQKRSRKLKKVCKMFKYTHKYYFNLIDYDPFKRYSHKKTLWLWILI